MDCGLRIEEPGPGILSIAWCGSRSREGIDRGSRGGPGGVDGMDAVDLVDRMDQGNRIGGRNRPGERHGSGGIDCGMRIDRATERRGEAVHQEAGGIIGSRRDCVSREADGPGRGFLIADLPMPQMPCNAATRTSGGVWGLR